MPIIPYRPIWDLDEFFEDVDWPRLPKIMTIAEPRMDIYEEGDNIVAEIEVPGISPEKIEVTVKDNVLRVEGGEEKKIEEKKKGYYRKEISRGSFRRMATLPAGVVNDKAEASYIDGILKVVIPKAKPAKKEEKKLIKIKVKTKVI